MIEKIDMTEEEIKLNYITPAITDKWAMSCIRMEFLVAPSRIMLDGKKAKCKDASRADYVLFYKDTSAWFPLAVVEAKDNQHPFAIRWYATGYPLRKSDEASV